MSLGVARTLNLALLSQWAGKTHNGGGVMTSGRSAFRLIATSCLALVALGVPNLIRGGAVRASMAGCLFSISPMSKSYTPDLAMDSVQVTTLTSCPWQVVSNVQWIGITSPIAPPPSGTEPFNFSVQANIGAPNTNTPPRTGTVTVTDTAPPITTLTFTATQSGCSFSVPQSNVCFPADQASDTLFVQTGSATSCPWTAASNSSWISVATGSSSGDERLPYSVSQNSGVAARTGTISAAGQTVTINQTGAVSCAYPIAPSAQSFSAAASAGSISVTTPPCACSWTAATTTSWITIDSGSSGSGSGTVGYSVAANPTIFGRTGTITAAGQTFTVTQAGEGCSYQISPTSRIVGAQSATGSIAINAPDSCTWTANTGADWIAITSGVSGSGNGTINYSVRPNTTSASRTGTITIADQTFTLTQTAGGCTYSISPAGRAFGPAGGSDSITVAAPDGCMWSASTNSAWITIPSGGSGSGNGSFNYSVAANTGPNAREGLLAIADQTFAIDQAAPGDEADLSVAVSASPSPVAAATRLAYTIVVDNAGPNAATGVTVAASTPVGTTFTSLQGPGTLTTPLAGHTGAVLATVGSIPAGGSITLSLAVNVLEGPGSALAISTTVSSLTTDPVSGNNSAAVTTRILGGGIVDLSWDQPPSTAADPTPPPVNLKVSPAANSSTSPLSPEASVSASDATCMLLTYNIYISNSTPVVTTPGNLWKAVPPTNVTGVPVGPGGSFYVVTTVWNCNGTLIESGLSGGSNQTGVPGGPTVLSVRVGAKLKALGSEFGDGVQVFLDGIAFSRPSSVRNDNSLVVQKGALVDGRNIADVLLPEKTVVISFRNSAGGIATFNYTQQ